ncbi:MAG: hypothetical protein HY812_05655 [Planctomycetes bacterium]|nr:hypothetical protein [Planctomycetota bacterium]
MKIQGVFLALVVVAATPLFAREDGDSIVCPLGVDLLQMNGTLHLAVPQDFFAPGSASYTGDVPAGGVLINTACAYELGTTSLIVRRNSSVSIPLPQSQPAHVLTTVSGFALSGTQRITVLVGGVPQEWSVSASLSPETMVYGSYDLTRTSLSSGTFTANIELPLLFVFRRGNVVRTLDLGVATLVTSGGTWTTIATSPTAALAVSNLQPGVALTGTLTSTALRYVDPTAIVDPGVGSLGRYCPIGAGATVAAGAVIGPHAVIGDNAHIGAGAVIGDRASIGPGVVVGDGAALDSFAVLASGCMIGADVILGTGANLGISCQVGDGAVILGGSVLESGCVIGSGAWLGRQVRARTGATVGAGVEIASGAAVPSSPAQLTDIVCCTLGDGSVEYRTLPTSSWPPGTPPATIQQDSSVSGGSGSLAAPPVMATLEPVDKGNPPAGYNELGERIGKNIAPPGNGGTGKPYKKGEYGCAWYAEQLRIQLDPFYDTTFTAYLQLNPDWKEGSAARKWIHGHALTDIHWPDGTVTWISAQWPDGSGIDKQTPKLDGNGDGKVTVAWGSLPDQPTDGDIVIGVFETRAEAEAAGATCTGN